MELQAGMPEGKEDEMMIEPESELMPEEKGEIADKKLDLMAESEPEQDQMPGEGDEMAGAGSDGMGSESIGTGMPESREDDGMVRVLVEMRVESGTRGLGAQQMAGGLVAAGFEIDAEYEPIPMLPDDSETRDLQSLDEETVVVRGTVSKGEIPNLEAQPNVVKVYLDVPIAPFAGIGVEEETQQGLALMSPAAACPIPPCDCSPGTAKGDIPDVARYLGVDKIWSAGRKGDGIVIGIVDGGISADGRVPGGKIKRVIGGWPTDWGKKANWGEHGNMTATDALGMAPNAQVYDIRISDGDAISNALAGFNWAIAQHKKNGTPHILSNSWGIFQEAWDKDYARNPKHPFTKKVVEALNQGILVLFAAGNCGAACPDGRCGSDSGPGRSIWGANGHPQVMTVAAVNKNEQYVGYSSAGPAALDPKKPDFCSITHFKGYFPSDSGTSAATPIAAGVVALLKQAKPSLTQNEAKGALMSTAKGIGPAGWDQYSGAGIIRAKSAYDKIGVPAKWSRWQNLGGVCDGGVAVSSWAPNRLDCFVLGTDRALYHKWWNGASWKGWERLGGECYSAPAAVSWGPNRIDAFVLGRDRAMYHKWWNGSSWKGWERLGGVCDGGVAVSSWAPNRLDCFVLGTDRALYHKWWNGSSWKGWERLGGECYSAPAAVSWGPNRIDTFVLGRDRAMYHKWWNGSKWSRWERLGGICDGGVAAASWAPNRLDCFVLGTDRALYHKWWDGSSWKGWKRVGGECYSAPGAESWGPNRLDVFVLGRNRAMYHKWRG